MPNSSPIPTRSTGCACSARKAHHNVVALRTFSKAFGLAGLRIGYAIGHPRILDAARSTSIPLSVTAQAEEAALASLDAEEALLERVRTIAQRRDRLAAGLRKQRMECPGGAGQLRVASRRSRDDGDRRGVRRRRTHRAAVRR